MLMLLLQAAQQATPNTIYVQQAPGGTSEWSKTLISATIGALVGIFSNLAMEYVKPFVTDALMKRTIRKQIHAELFKNLNDLEAAVRIGERVDEKSEIEVRIGIKVCGQLLEKVRSDRFEYFFDQQKSLIYEIDPPMVLGAFYETVKRVRLLDAKEAGFFSDYKSKLGLAAIEGKSYCAIHKLTFRSFPSSMEHLYEQQVGMAKAGYEIP